MTTGWEFPQLHVDHCRGCCNLLPLIVYVQFTVSTHASINILLVHFKLNEGEKEQTTYYFTDSTDLTYY
jgi:hypothetical protein